MRAPLAAILVALLVACASSGARWLTTWTMTTPGMALINGAWEGGAGPIYPVIPAIAGREGEPCSLAPTTSNFGVYADHGAARVRIRVAGLAEPLYGVFALCAVPPGAVGPGSRMYSVQVPQDYVDATTDGRVSVVFEETEFGGAHSGRTWNWILWLSRLPI